MKIALDVMGGDYAPRATVTGAWRASQAMPEHDFVLIGRTQDIEAELARLGLPPESFRIVHADEVIDMADHPTKAFSHKPNSSIAVGFALLKTGEIDGFASAGNTGAMMVGAMFSLKTIDGITRPAIAGYVPKTNGETGVLIDIGANADVKPEIMSLFAEIGSLYALHVLGIANPKVGLLNLGEEEQKGTMLTQAAFQLLKINSKINFIGNIEGRDIFNEKADVIVCDGFTGNVVTKMAESIYDIMMAEGGHPDDSFFHRLNYEQVGGSPIVGVNGTVVIGHGLSTESAICKMLEQTAQLAASGLHLKIQASLNEFSI